MINKITKYKLFVTFFSTVLFILFNISCNCSSTTLDNNTIIFPRKVSLEEATKVLGTGLPMPGYLPNGFNIRGIFIEETTLINNVSFNPISILILKDGVEGEFINEIKVFITWFEKGGIPIRPPFKTVTINKNIGYISEQDDKIIISWNWYPKQYDPGMFELEISATKEISIDELIKIAESIIVNS